MELSSIFMLFILIFSTRSENKSFEIFSTFFIRFGLIISIILLLNKSSPPLYEAISLSILANNSVFKESKISYFCLLFKSFFIFSFSFKKFSIIDCFIFSRFSISLLYFSSSNSSFFLINSIPFNKI